MPAFEAGYTLKDTHREYAVKGIRCLNQNIIMKIQKLIEELKQYPSETEVSFSLVVDEDNACQDESLEWIGEIDTSLMDSENPIITIGLEKE